VFDTFLGLPLHVLVLHFTVVLVPLTAVATPCVFLHRPWREKYAGRMAAVNAAMVVLTFVTVRAGLALQDRYQRIGNNDVPRYDHQELGETLLWIVLALAVATALAWVGSRRSGLPAGAARGMGAMVAGLAVAAVVFTVLTGHTGSESHWKDFVTNSNAAQ
jgi:hypothetical protein